MLAYRPIESIRWMASATNMSKRSKTQRETRALVCQERRTGEVPEATRWSGTGDRGLQAEFRAESGRLDRGPLFCAALFACQDGLTIVYGEGSISPAGGVVL